MGWVVCLKDDKGKCCEVPSFYEGSNIRCSPSQLIKGSNGMTIIKAESKVVPDITVTYNYGKLFSFSRLDGKTGKVSQRILKRLISRLGHSKPSKNYWKCTKGNVRKIAQLLLSWAQIYPTAIWDVQL